jgi:phage baseplate assembly protein W
LLTDQIRDSIKQVLLTNPGERLNQPDFGVGIQQYVFEPNSSASRAAIQDTVQQALNHWLGNIIDVEEVDVMWEESSITVAVRYKVLSTNQLRQDNFFQNI